MSTSRRTADGSQIWRIRKQVPARQVGAPRRNPAQVTLHSDGKELEWGGAPHEELSFLFADIARDYENKVVILTGTGESFCANPPPTGSASLKSSAWDRVYNEGKHLLMNHLNIEVPMIAAVNGPAHRHAELAVLCDIVLAADHTTFQDSAHFPNGTVPGDGAHGALVQIGIGVFGSWCDIDRGLECDRSAHVSIRPEVVVSKVDRGLTIRSKGGKCIVAREVNRRRSF
jgi:hypothetical protein